MTAEPSPESQKPVRLLRNLVTLYGGEMLAKVLSLVIFGTVSRTLGDAVYGEVEFALGITFVLILVMEAGLGPFAAREAARDPRRTEALAGHVALIRIVLVIAALVILVTIAYALDRSPLGRKVLLTYGLVLLPWPWLLNWAFQARDRMEVVALSSLLRQAIMLGIVLVVVRSPEDAWWVPVADAAGFVVIAVMQVSLFRRSGARIRPFADLAGARRTAREGLPLALSSVVWALRLHIPLLALGVHHEGAESTGHYGAGHRLVIALHSFVWLYFFNLLPSISRHLARSDHAPYRELMRHSLYLVGHVAVGGGILGCILAPVILPAVFGAEYAAGTPAFQIMLWVLLAAFLSGHHRFSLIGMGRQVDELKANAAGALVAVAGCVSLGTALTPVWAAGFLLASEVTTLLVAAWILHLRGERLPTIRAVTRPVFVGAAGWIAGWWLTDGSPWGTAAVAAVAILGGVLLARRQVASSLAHLRGVVRD